MKLSLLVAGAAMFTWAAVHAQQTQTPTSGTAGSSAGDAWFPSESQFRTVVLDEDQTVNGELTDSVVDPMELAVAKDGRVFWASGPGS